MGRASKIDQNAAHFLGLCLTPNGCAINLQNMFEKIIRYRYWMLFGFFTLWMLFFDSNNLFYRISIARDISELEEMKALHEKSIADLQRQKKELFGNTRNLEKLAREKHLMKKDNEDLFIIVKDSTTK